MPAPIQVETIAAMMKKIYSGKTSYCTVYKDDISGEHFIDAICPSVVWHSLCVRMSDDERKAFEEDVTFADDLCLKICRSLEDYEDRAVDYSTAAKWRSTIQ